MSSRIDVWDAGAKIRGHMVAGSGTFSGTFASDNVDALSEINIRDGAVSSHFVFGADGSRDITFNIPDLGGTYMVEMQCLLQPNLQHDSHSDQGAGTDPWSRYFYVDGVEEAGGVVSITSSVLPIPVRWVGQITGATAFRLLLPKRNYTYQVRVKRDGDWILVTRYATGWFHIHGNITVSVWKR